MSNSVEQIRACLKSSVSSSMQENIHLIDQIFEGNSDLIKKNLKLFNGAEAIILYIDSIVDTEFIQNQVVLPLTQSDSYLPSEHENRKKAKNIDPCKYFPLYDSVVCVTEIETGIQGILRGETLLFVSELSCGYLFNSSKRESRQSEESPYESVVRGPRDGFNENIRTNLSLVRQRISDPLLRVELMKIGTRTMTDVYIVYIKDIAKESLVAEVRTRLKKIKTDSILESTTIEEFINDAPLSVFPTIDHTQRPDKVAANILEGKVAIMVNNTPDTLLMPTTFWAFMSASDDNYTRYWTGSFLRIIRFIALILCFILSPLYVLLASFHFELIPTDLAITIAAGEVAVPFPPLIEVLFMEIVFDLIRESGLRMPKPIGPAVSFAGSIVLGQAAVQAGIVSPIVLISVASSGIFFLTIPGYDAAMAVRLLRYPFIIFSGILGILGFGVLAYLLLMHLLSLRSFGVSYLAPVSPVISKDFASAILRIPFPYKKSRPQFAGRNRKTSK